VLADYFGTRYFGTVNGVMSLVQTLGAFFGPWLVGALVDSTGAYTAGWLLCALFAALSVPLMLLATPPERLIRTYRDVARAPGTAT
jgi:MFS family permease